MTRRPGNTSITAAVVEFLRKRPQGATMAEIADAVMAQKAVQRHSVRAAVLSHVQGRGRELFVQEKPAGGGRNVYKLA